MNKYEDIFARLDKLDKNCKEIRQDLDKIKHQTKPTYTIEELIEIYKQKIELNIKRLRQNTT